MSPATDIVGPAGIDGIEDSTVTPINTQHPAMHPAPSNTNRHASSVRNVAESIEPRFAAPSNPTGIAKLFPTGLSEHPERPTGTLQAVTTPRNSA